MISSNDLIKKANYIMDRIYFDGLTSKEQKVAINSVLLSYTKNKFLNSIDRKKEYNNFLEILSDCDYLLENQELRSEFYDNYIKLIIDLMSKHQNFPITWDKTIDICSPILESKIAYGYVDKIITSESIDSLVNLEYIYNLYTSDMKRVENSSTFTYYKKNNI